MRKHDSEIRDHKGVPGVWERVRDDIDGATARDAARQTCKCAIEAKAHCRDHRGRRAK